MMMGELWSQAGSMMGSLVFIYAMFKQFFPYHLQDYLEKYFKKLVSFAYPYVEITFNEFTGERMKRCEAYSAIKTYLSDKSSASAKRLKADVGKDSQSVVLSMDYNEEVIDEFQGVKVWWSAMRNLPKTQRISWYPADDEMKYYKLTVHKSHRELITESYVSHVLKEGKAIATKNRQRKMYSNNPSDNWYGYKRSKWSNVVFEHPSTFDTLAMDAKMKEEIKNDLIKFSKGKDYYARIGKAWKRGYLLYGPPGTGKSSMIAAMANLLDYDVYDLELTAVKDNTELRRLLIDTSNKSIVVIEDIDCSLDLTGQREKKKEKDSNEELDPVAKKAKEEEKKDSKVTLSGLLNCVDGLWSSCGGERIIIFTTNHVEKLDPALIRRGRMDMHIEMSYCCFDAFKVLAKNYLEIDSHPLFGEIERLLGETKMTPADVAENLMPKSDYDNEKTCLERLIEALKVAKEEAIKKEEEEARAKAEKEDKKKEQSAKDVKEVKENDVAAEEVKENSVAAKEVKENCVAAKEEVKENGVAAKEVKENGVAAEEVKENGVIH